MRITAQYYQEGSESPITENVLSVGAAEANSYGFAVFVVNNNEMIVPTLDEQNKLRFWTKVTFDHIVTNPTSNVTLFEYEVQESDLEQLIGEDVRR